MVDSLEHQFNGDLLISTHDQELAKKVYEEIFHVLDHARLREEFGRYDNAAMASKSWVHWIGMLAILLAAIALIGSAITPVVHQLHPPEWVHSALLAAEIGGIVGVIIAAGGIALSKRKDVWLRNRMMAEVVRLWHFQSLICRGKQIDSCYVAADHKAGRALYRQERDVAFQTFLHEWTTAPDSHLKELIENPAEGYEMLHDERAPYPAGSPVIDKIFQAYKAIRFKHQANYAGHKLQKKTDRLSILKWPAAVLQSRIQFFTSMCLVLSLGCSLLIIVGHWTQWTWTEPYLPAAIISLLVLNVTGRAVQDGLAAPEEFQRYNDYAGKIAYLKQRFETVQTNEEKLNVMVEMERAALEELKGFLRAHDEAKFIV